MVYCINFLGKYFYTSRAEIKAGHLVIFGNIWKMRYWSIYATTIDPPSCCNPYIRIRPSRYLGPSKAWSERASIAEWLMVLLRGVVCLFSRLSSGMFSTALWLVGWHGRGSLVCWCAKVYNVPINIVLDTQLLHQTDIKSDNHRVATFFIFYF